MQLPARCSCAAALDQSSELSSDKVLATCWWHGQFFVSVHVDQNHMVPFWGILPLQHVCAGLACTRASVPLHHPAADHGTWCACPTRLQGRRQCAKGMLVEQGRGEGGCTSTWIASSAWTPLLPLNFTACRCLTHLPAPCPGYTERRFQSSLYLAPHKRHSGISRRLLSRLTIT